MGNFPTYQIQQRQRGARTGPGSETTGVSALSKLYIDATVPLRWGPHPPVGIPRVESAIVRQALRSVGAGRNARQVRFFMINRNGEARFLDRRELTYLGDLVEGRAAAVESGASESLMSRTRLVLKSIRAGAATTGKEFDRVSASYISGRNDRRGFGYQAAKTFIRAAKLIGGRRVPAFTRPGPDPLLDADASCFLSTAGLHALASSGLLRRFAVDGRAAAASRHASRRSCMTSSRSIILRWSTAAMRGTSRRTSPGCSATARGS